MTQSLYGSVVALYSYPIKGLTAQPVDCVDLLAGQGFPGDRAFGFARAGHGFDPETPRPLPKTKFVVLARDPRLAALTTVYDAATRKLQMTGPDRVPHEFDMAVQSGVDAATDLLMRQCNLPADERPDLLHAHPHRFTDVSVTSETMMNAVSILNLASLRQAGKDFGVTLSPARFRANVLVDGWSAFAENHWVGREITLGQVLLRVLKRTQRCAATEVDPMTARRDVQVPRLLHQHYGQMDMGVYAEVLEAGRLCRGDRAQTA